MKLEVLANATSIHRIHMGNETSAPARLSPIHSRHWTPPAAARDAYNIDAPSFGRTLAARLGFHLICITRPCSHLFDGFDIVDAVGGALLLSPPHRHCSGLTPAPPCVCGISRHVFIPSSRAAAAPAHVTLRRLPIHATPKMPARHCQRGRYPRTNKSAPSPPRRAEPWGHSVDDAPSAVARLPRATIRLHTSARECDCTAWRPHHRSSGN